MVRLTEVSIVMARISERSRHRHSAVAAHSVGQMLILKATGPLCDAVEDLDRATRLALCRAPRGVVCDLSRIVAPSSPGALRRLATIGRHPRDWPATPVAMAGLAPRVGERLSRLPLGPHLVITDAVADALSRIMRTSCPTARQLLLLPRPTAPRVARSFVRQTLSDWGLDAATPAASLVASELVTNAVLHARTDMVLSLATDRGLLRVAVSDNSRRSPQIPSRSQSRGMGLRVVAGAARAWGMLPADTGGKVVWAVLDDSS